MNLDVGSKTEPSTEASHISAHQALDIHFGVEIAP